MGDYRSTRRLTAGVDVMRRSPLRCLAMGVCQSGRPKVAPIGPMTITVGSNRSLQVIPVNLLQTKWFQFSAYRRCRDDLR